MSYIDTFDHELVAFFAGLPLYHPLEEVRSQAGIASEFGCTPAHLILGGGDGEHPAMILSSPDAAVCYFLQSALPPDAPPLPAEEQAILDEAAHLDIVLAFPGWRLKDTAAFVARCASPAFVRPYNASEDGLLEHWITCNLGEFVCFAMPELAAETLARLPETQALVSAPIFHNALILPPGYGAPAGRYRDHTGQVVWGAYPWIVTRRQSDAR